MKLGYGDVDAFLQKPDKGGAVSATLLYGPNTALIDQRVRLISQKILPGGDDGFNMVTLTPDQLKQNATAIADELTTMSFFGGRKLILFKDADDRHLSAVTDAVGLLAGVEHYLVVVGGELSARSALRLWAEKDKAVAALACYEYDVRDMGRLLQAEATRQNARLDRDAADLLIQVLGTQADFIPPTLAKLVDYAGGGMGTTVTITADMVRVSCVDQTDATTDDIIQDAVGGQLAPLQRHLNHYYAAGENSIQLLRLLQNYLYRLKTVQAAVQDGQAPDAAMQGLKPPVFFKQKQTFLRHLQRMSGPAVDGWLAEAVRIEILCKQTGSPDELLVRQMLLDMATAR